MDRSRKRGILLFGGLKHKKEDKQATRDGNNELNIYLIVLKSFAKLNCQHNVSALVSQ